MSSITRECPKCRGSMEEGFLLDMTHGAFLATHWVSGKPERSFWTGIKMRGRRKQLIRTFRCTTCGLLESYAP